MVVQLNRSQSVTLAALKTGLGLAAAMSASRDTRVKANASDIWWSSRQRSPTSPVSSSRTTATGMNLFWRHRADCNRSSDWQSTTLLSIA
ncbi:hypothetical protein FCV25MIE_10493 [Fagus crenata]